MKALTFYSGVTTVYTYAIIILLFWTDVSYLSDKSVLSLVISFFGCLEIIKYFLLSSHAQDFDKLIISSSSSYPHSGHKANEKKMKQMFKGVILLIIMTLIIHIVIILFGASVIENFEETLLLSVLLCTLAFLPLCFYYGPNLAVAVLFNNRPSHTSSFEIMLIHTVYFTVCGTWIGALVIPLDWDRPWQKWPVPCAVGALLGYGASHIVSFIRSFFRVTKHMPV